MINPDRLRELRFDRGYSQRQLAALAGLGPLAIRRLEQGADGGELPARVLGRLATALGVTADELTTAPPGDEEDEDACCRAGALLLTRRTVTTDDLAAHLGLPADALEPVLTALTDKLAPVGMTITARPDGLRLQPTRINHSALGNTTPLTAAQAHLLRRIHRGDDTRRSLSHQERQFIQPRLARLGLITRQVQPRPTAVVQRSLSLQGDTEPPAPDTP